MKKTKTFVIAILLILCTQLGYTQTKVPVLCTNNYSEVLEEGDILNCNTLTDLSVVVPFTEEMKKYDLVRIEFRCLFDKNEIKDLGYIEIEIGTKEYDIKYAGKTELKYWIVNPESPKQPADFTSTGKIAYSDMKSQICYNKRYNYFSVAVLGYIKTGTFFRRNQYGNVKEYNEYDKGTLLTESIKINNDLGINGNKNKKGKMKNLLQEFK